MQLPVEWGRRAVRTKPELSVHIDRVSCYVPANEYQDCFTGRDVHFERCPPIERRRRGPRSVAAFTRRQTFRFTTLVGTPGKLFAEPANAPSSQLLVLFFWWVTVVGYGGSNCYFFNIF